MNRNRSTRTDDYLAAIKRICESEDSNRAGTSAIAERLGLTVGTVSVTVKKLAEQGLIDLIPHHGSVLTAEGSHRAQRVLHRVQRLAEFLNRTLGFTCEVAEEEAWLLEVSVSEKLMGRIDAFIDDATTS